MLLARGRGGLTCNCSSVPASPLLIGEHDWGDDLREYVYVLHGCWIAYITIAHDRDRIALEGP